MKLDRYVELLQEDYSFLTNLIKGKTEVPKSEPKATKPSAKSSNSKEDTKKEETPKSTLTELEKRINKHKGKLYRELVDFCNIIGGVGIWGDRDTKNATNKTTSKDEEGNESSKTMGIPSDEIIRGYLTQLKADAKTLEHYEYGYYKEINDDEIKKYGGANKQYMKAGKQSSTALLKVLNSIHISDLDWDEERIPYLTNAPKDAGGYARIQSFDPDEAKNMSKDDFIKKGLGSGARPLGKKRFNADIYEDLYPFLEEFKKFSPTYTGGKNFLKDYLETNRDNDNKEGLKKAMGKTIIKDLVSSKKENYEDRKKAMEKAIDDDKYEDRRKIERDLDELTKLKTYRNKEGKIDHGEYMGAKIRGKKAELEQFKKEGSTSATKDYFSEHKIPSLSLSNFKKGVAKWTIKDDSHIVKLFGGLPIVGTGFMIAFVPASLCPNGKPLEGQPSYEGLYAVNVNRNFYDNAGPDARKFIEDKRVHGRTRSEWKEGALKALKLKASSVATEEVNYFPY